jgi:hypothetical protein
MSKATAKKKVCDHARGPRNERGMCPTCNYPCTFSPNNVILIGKGDIERFRSAIKKSKPMPISRVSEDRAAERRWLLAQGAVVGLIVARNAIGDLRGAFAAHHVVSFLLKKQEREAAKLMARLPK